MNVSDPISQMVRRRAETIANIETEKQDLINLKPIVDGLIPNIKNESEPLTHYESIFDNIETWENKLRSAKIWSENITSSVENLNKEIEAVDQKINEAKTALNKNKFKFGLKGQLKQSLSESNPSEMTAEEADAFEAPYIETPFNPERGGNRKKSRKTKKRRKNGHKKTNRRMK